MALDERVRAVVPGCEAALEQICSGPVLVVRTDAIVDVLRYLRDDPDLGFDMLVDITAIDYRPAHGCFHVVYLLRSLARNARLTVKVKPAGDDPVVPSVAALWKNANWAEREVWDMFGVRFVGHPDLRRILLYEEFVGHPLRKDYPVERRQPLIPERDPITDPWPSRDGL
jgi:NADH-quinone oxidoreductase subunit C